VARRKAGRGVRDSRWRDDYEQLRAAVLAGRTPEGEAARRLERFGLLGLANRNPAWEVRVNQAPEPRWTGTDPRLVVLRSAYQLVITGGRA
jgi:hypothetical protein